MKLKSKTLTNYYGNNPSEYDLVFIHYNIDIEDESSEEYDKLKEDFNNIYNLNQESFLLYFSDIDNLLKVNNNIKNNYKKYLRIRNIEEYNKVKELGINNIYLIVDINDLEKLNITDYDLVIQIDKVSELPISKLDELVDKYNIKEILLGQISYLTKEDEELYDVMSKMYNVAEEEKIELEHISKITNDLYSVNEYKEIVNKFNEIITKLDNEDEISSIYKIFNYITDNLVYDNDGVEKTKINNQNLIGPVLKNIGVCEGYAKYLEQILSLINVEVITVSGGGQKEEGGHVWNQILVNDTWYNADVVSAYYSKENMCLVKDSNLLYKANTNIAHECKEDFKVDNKKLLTYHIR